MRRRYTGEEGPSIYRSIVEREYVDGQMCIEALSINVPPPRYRPSFTFTHRCTLCFPSWEIHPLLSNCFASSYRSSPHRGEGYSPIFDEALVTLPLQLKRNNGWFRNVCSRNYRSPNYQDQFC